MAKYIQIVDGEGFTVPKGEKWRFACCDCGLVHDVVLVPGRKEIGMAVRRNNRATAQRRKRKADVIELHPRFATTSASDS